MKTTQRHTQTIIGILALQGDYELHEHQLALAGACSHLVRLPADLNQIDGLIIPGGESTTMSILIDRFHLFDPLCRFGSEKSVYGTCAGMILMAAGITDNQSKVKSLNLLDIEVTRNGYGRQIHSQETELTIELGNETISLRAAFIRAPRITRVGEGLKVLGSYEGSAVVVTDGKNIACSFHSELDDDCRLLEYYLNNFVRPYVNN